MKNIIKFALLCVVLCSLIVLCACASQIPYIGENGNWWYDDKDLGIPAQGPKGEHGTGVTVLSVSKTDTVDNVDTYTIVYSDGRTTQFTVTNGTNGESVAVTDVSLTNSQNNVDTYTITFSTGAKTSFNVTNGTDGQNLSVVSIALNDSCGLCDTYRITYSDNTFVDFSVTNGSTPYIGENGNWWINDTDTNLLVDPTKQETRTITNEQMIFSAGLEFELKNINGQVGYCVKKYKEALDVTDYYKYANLISYDDYIKLGDDVKSHRKNLEIIIPNYVGTIPVIGVSDAAFYENYDISFVSLSQNTEYLGNAAFEDCARLRTIDFNGAKPVALGDSCFQNDDNLINFEMPSSVVYVGKNCFFNCNINEIDFSGIKYIGEGAFCGYQHNVFLPKTVEYVGSHAFGGGYLYIEHETVPETWGDEINYLHYQTYNGYYDMKDVYEEIDTMSQIVTNCKINDDYIYSIGDDGVTLYQYLGNAQTLRLPQTVDNIGVVAVGYGFNSYIFDEDEISDEYAMPTEKYLKEIIVPSNVKRIDFGALLCNGTFIYLEDGVSEVFAYIGCDYQFEIEGRLSIIIAENPTDMLFEIDDEEYTWQDYYDAVTECTDLPRLYSGIKYDDIYYDANTKTFFAKENGYYTVIACMDMTAQHYIVPDEVNGVPVKQINKFAYTVDNSTIVSIGHNIKKIKSNAFNALNDDIDVKVYIPQNVEIINANGFDGFDYITYYLENASKPDDWDTNWCDGSKNIQYSYDEAEFNSLFVQ